MASRYPTTRVLDYCLHPVRLVQDSEVIYVPCGKCDGCLLHKANEWSMRVGCEIENCPFPMFFTLTYNNKYLPTLRYVNLSVNVGYSLFSSSHSENIRFNGVEDVRRNDLIAISQPLGSTGIPATNYVCDVPYIAYVSKFDIQLYLKLLRKDLYVTFPQKTDEERKIRYYIISEYGATLLRPHYHGVFFVYDGEIADYLLYSAIFKNWQMCDVSRYDVHLCDSGCRGYITQYLSCNTLLPQVYKYGRIKPFRIASKNPAIGYSEFDKAKIFEDVITGNITFVKDIKRTDERCLLRYPSAFMSRLFPKCFKYREYDFRGLCALYGLLYYLVEDFGADFADFRDRLCKDEHAADWQATKACYDACCLLSWNPYTYVYALDMYYYKKEMAALSVWYSWQEERGNTLEVMRSYSNLSEYARRLSAHTLYGDSYHSFRLFLYSFNVEVYDVGYFNEFDFSTPASLDYALEVSDILSDMVKMPKFNEQFGFSPNSSI